MRVVKALILILATVSIGLVVLSFSRKSNPSTGPTPSLRGAAPAPQGSSPTSADFKTESTQIQTNSTARPLTGGPRPVAVVNGTTITAREVENELNHLLISASTHAGVDEKKKDGLRKAALEELIVRELAYQKARLTGLSVPAFELMAGVRRIRNRYQSRKAFEEALAAEHITEQELRWRIERDLLLKKIFQLEITAKAKVSDKETRRHYEENKQKFVVPESVQCKGILIKVGSGNDAEAKRKIDEVSAKLKAGGDFGELAYQFSEDDYRVTSGDYGSVHRGQLEPELERVIFAQKPGQVSSPFKTNLGWHIVRVEKKQPEHQLTYSEVQEKIRTTLFQQREKQRRLDFIASLKGGAKIEYIQ